MAEATLTLQTAVEKACAAELTEKETSVLHGDTLVKKVEGTFPNVSDVENTTIHRKAVIIGTHDVTDARSPATLLQSVRRSDHQGNQQLMGEKTEEKRRNKRNKVESTMLKTPLRSR